MNIPITCVVCQEEIPEAEYPAHMATVHPDGQLGSIAAKKNVPKSAPPGINPGVFPDEEFEKTMAEIAKAEAEAKKPPVAQPSAPQTPSTPTPISLEYKYTGSCENGHSVSTLEMEVEEKHFVVAFCLQENKQLEVREVADLREKSTLLQMAELLAKEPPFNIKAFENEGIVNVEPKKKKGKNVSG